MITKKQAIEVYNDLRKEIEWLRSDLKIWARDMRKRMKKEEKIARGRVTGGSLLAEGESLGYDQAAKLVDTIKARYPMKLPKS